MNNELRGKFGDGILVTKPTFGFSLAEALPGVVRVLAYLFATGLAVKFARQFFAGSEVGLTILFAGVAITTLVLGLGHLAVCIFSRFSMYRGQQIDGVGSRSILGILAVATVYFTLLSLFSVLAWQLAKWCWNLL